jgi:hypothetical protein
VPESDEFLRFRINELCNIIEEVGPEKFQQAITRCLRIYSNRWQFTIANIRREAGLECTPAQPAHVEAWEIVTECLKNHVARNAEGRVVLEPKIVMRDGRPTVRSVPRLSDAIERAVSLMGGWESLWQAWPTYWNMRFQQFKECYRP